MNVNPILQQDLHDLGSEANWNRQDDIVFSLFFYGKQMSS